MPTVAATAAVVIFVANEMKYDTFVAFSLSSGIEWVKSDVELECNTGHHQVTLLQQWYLALLTDR